MQPFRTLNRALARLLSVRLCNVPHAYSVRLRAYLACSYAIFRTLAHLFSVQLCNISARLFCVLARLFGYATSRALISRAYRTLIKRVKVPNTRLRACIIARLHAYLACHYATSHACALNFKRANECRTSWCKCPRAY